VFVLCRTCLLHFRISDSRDSVANHTSYATARPVVHSSARLRVMADAAALKAFGPNSACV
jgi:hypothetical protein